MRFKDEYFSKEHRYALGTDESTEKKYLSIPVSNSMIGYEEYYEVDSQTYAVLLKDPGRAMALAEKCRRQENDGMLIIKPGSDRGSC